MKPANAQGWLRGYFKHLENRAIAPNERLAVHCFKDLRGGYSDEYRRPLQEVTQPVGRMGLESHRTIDDAISGALGIPLAPD